MSAAVPILVIILILFCTALNASGKAHCLHVAKEWSRNAVIEKKQGESKRFKRCKVFISVCVETNGLQWKDTGEEFVIQCRSSEPGQEYLEVMKGLNEDVLVYSKKNKSEEDTISKDFTNRLQVHGKFPNISILIKNLISEDTGPYWCVYKMSDKSVKTKGRGSLLLVVKGKPLHFIQFAIRHGSYKSTSLFLHWTQFTSEYQLKSLEKCIGCI